MICKPCSKAGDRLTAFKNGQPRNYLWIARQLHKECTGCECQHKEQ